MKGCSCWRSKILLKISWGIIKMDKRTKKTLERNIKKSHKQFKKTLTINMYHILLIVSISVILSSFIFYFIGSNDGYTKKTIEIENLEMKQLESEMMNLEYSHLKEVFGSYVMIKTMLWLKWIFMAILLGWILHGVF